MRLLMDRAVGIDPSSRGSVWAIRPSARRGRHGTSGEANMPGLVPGSGRIVYVERDMRPRFFDEYAEMRKNGGRAFVLWADCQRQQVFARVVTKSAVKRGPATFEVLGAAGEPLGVVVREPGPHGWRMRTRWTVTPTGRAALTGYKGRLGWWLFWWLISPVQLVILVLAIIGADGDIGRTPRRIMLWDSASGELALDFEDEMLRVLDYSADPRLVAALFALLRSYPCWLGEQPWDKQDR
ncbi:hypothetical protein H0264_29305 [Nocardia huaxiensis]|uniref:Uncharacterized protein n=1 Tax=Nocardia huaxiensis TaxID=2755382 RepID=A0A7D6V7A9_9NOCA|nr:hypothetical protein [Nocardia huaxiensis]QLY29341.1 hypothetical protein H0264_29305 [Nocardia huaxiensis]